jgi:hypothetical protein
VLRVPEELNGRLVKCPACGTTFTAEAAPAAPLGQVPVEERPPWEQPGADVFEEAEEDYEEVDDRDRPRRRSRWRRRYVAPHRGNVILTLGIISLFVAHIPLGPIAWIMGNNDLAEMRAGRMDREGESSTNTGRICGMISTILSLVGLAIGLAILFCLFCGCAGLPIAGGLGGAGGGPPRPRKM